MAHDAPLGQWEAKLNYAYEARSGWKKKILDTDRADVLAGVPAPDLTVTSVTTMDPWGSSTSVTSGQPFQVTATVRNDGIASADASTFELRDVYDVTVTTLATVGIPTLGAGDVHTVTIDNLFLSQEGSHGSPTVPTDS